MKVRELDLLLEIPKMFEVGSAEVNEAIVKTVKIAFVQTQPELAGNIVDHGTVITRGGALLKNIDRLLGEETMLPITITEDSLSSLNEVREDSRFN